MSCRNRSVHPWPSARAGPLSLQTWRNIRLIIGREYKNQVTQRIFIIMSIILLVIVFLAAFIPTIVQFVTSGSNSNTQTSIVMVNEAGPIAGLNGATLTSYIGSELNGTTTGSQASYAISSQPAASLSSLKLSDIEVLSLADSSHRALLLLSRRAIQRPAIRCQQVSVTAPVPVTTST